MYRIRRFGIIKTATVVAVLYMVAIAVFIIPLALILVAVAPTGTVGQEAVPATLVGIVTFALVAIVGYGIVGWVFTAIACALYNLVAGWTGGIEVLVEPVAPPPPLPAWGSGPELMPPTSPGTPPYGSGPEPPA